ncbi:sugar phosphate isomerase/epimerase family protein [Bacillus horti]|uniref:Sugar phosphate isomerase/epimerase n=1 Tax=Caldalkalibacillus horti TaxID=77523 RepID=A0ABT9W141_9BACI|nr:sugar phosphate isomerase/epimerase [Bacillus horti]MDQ0166986.1 sugar phosphate isomerase/epimerase [Bacillus horti]
MTKQFSLAHLTVLECSPPELIYLASKAGYDFVSLRTICMGLPGEPNYTLHENKELLKQTKAALAETELKLLDIELARIYDGLDPKTYVPAFEVAAELGGRHVLSSIWTDDESFYTECFAEICDLAKPYGLTVELEFVPIASITTLADTLKVLVAVDKENAGLMVDAHHFYRSGDSVEDLDSVPQEWFRYFHLCDAPSGTPQSKEEMIRILREERLYVGEGGIDLKRIVERLPNIPLSLEIPNSKRAKELGYEEFARRCLQSAKNYFA